MISRGARQFLSALDSRFAGRQRQLLADRADRIGRIRQDNHVMLRIETLVGPAPTPATGYWRGLAFDHFDGRAWSITPAQRHTVAGTAESGIAFGRSTDAAVDLVQRIVREPVESGVIFSAGRTREIQGTKENCRVG